MQTGLISEKTAKPVENWAGGNPKSTLLETAREVCGWGPNEERRPPRGGGKPGWDRCFLALRGDTLYVLGQAVDGGTDEGTLASLCRDRLCLCPPDGEALVSSAVSASELLGTAKTDLPYTFKLELRPTSTCWPSRWAPLPFQRRRAFRRKSS